MLSYHYVPEELNKRILRVLHTMLLAYILPLWMQLIYMGDAAGDMAIHRIRIWNESLHPVTVALLAENLMMVLYVVVLEVVQRRIRNFWLYCGIHAGCMVLIWSMMIDSAGRIPRLIVCILLLVCAFYARIHETHLGYPGAGWLAIGILMVIMACQTDLHDMQVMGCITEIVSAVLCVLYYNVISIEHALEHTKGAGQVPYDKVRQINLVVMALWLMIAVALIVLIVFSGLGYTAFELLGQGAVWCLRQIIRFLLFVLSLLPQPGEVYQETAGMVEQFEMGEVDPISSILAIILIAIWETLVALQRIIAVLLIVWLVVQASRWLYHAFRSADLEERRRIPWQRATERAVWVSQRTTTGLSLLDPSPAARIRRIYIRFIRQGGGYRYIRESMTPAELMTVSVNGWKEIDSTSNINSSDQTSARMNRILELYEMARYMPARCTFQHVREMHHAVRALREEMRQLDENGS